MAFASLSVAATPFKFGTAEFRACCIAKPGSLESYLETVYSNAEGEFLEVYQANFKHLAEESKATDKEIEVTRPSEALYLPSAETLYLLSKDFLTRGGLTRESPIYKGLIQAFISSLFRKVVKAGHEAITKEGKKAHAVDGVKCMQDYTAQWIRLLTQRVADGKEDRVCLTWGHQNHLSLLEISKTDERMMLHLYDPQLPKMGSPVGTSPHMVTQMSLVHCLGIAKAIIRSWTEDQRYYLSLLDGYRFTAVEPSAEHEGLAGLDAINCTLAAPLAWVQSRAPALAKAIVSKHSPDEEERRAPALAAADDTK